MNYWKVILATVVIFGAGVVTGGLLVNYVNHPHAKNPRHAQESHVQQRPAEIPMPRFAEKMGKQLVQELNDRLQLAPEQREKIEKVIADGQERNHEIWTNAAPKMRAVMQDVNRQIRAELTPQQVKIFEEILRHPPRRPQNLTNVIVLPPINLPTRMPTNAPGV